MNPVTTALRLGAYRGFIELRYALTHPQDLWQYLSPSVISLVVMFFAADSLVPGTNLELASWALPSLVGASVAFGALVATMMTLALEREDGTLLRAKAVPHGMLGYLVGTIVMVVGMAGLGVVVLTVPGLIAFDGVSLGSPGAWLTLLWVFVLGLVAVLPLGAVAGSLLSSPRNIGVVVLPVMGLVAISGIFYPITDFPGWLQGIAQIFPIYWLGLGTRSAMLPDAMAAVEIGESWRQLETAAVLGAWAVAGLLIAPLVLRRMARRESGSRLAARREQALRRGM